MDGTFLTGVKVAQVLLFLAVFPSAVCTDLFSEYADHAVLDAEEKMKLFWNIDWDAETVSFAVEAETTGWVGFGFSTGSGQMIGSDVVIGWVKDNKGYLTDRSADAKEVPSIDEQQDYELMGFQESGGKTLLKFKRKFDTCDSRDRKLENGATKVVFAYHTEDPVSPTDLKQHVFRGVKTILLFNRKPLEEGGWSEYILTAKNVTIPSKATSYLCTLLKGPELSTKHHIIKVEPYIQKGNEGLVHHSIVYFCDGNFTEENFGESFDCSYMQTVHMPFRQCQKADQIAAWGVGRQAFYFPPQCGLPLGGKNAPKNLLLETHYNNPGKLVGRKDSSGARIFFTDKLRQFDAGLLTIGVDINSWQIIPPKEKNWISTGYCMHQCSESALKSTTLPGGGINIVASLPHTHVAGRATWTKHIRKGKELPDIACIDNYDPNFQVLHILRQEVNIQPGDDLVHYCMYNSMDRDQPIFGGPSARSNEMCLNFMVYYPSITGFIDCNNTVFEPSLKLIDKYLDNVTVTSLSENPLASMNINWTYAMTADLKRYESDVQAVIPGCWRENLSSVADIKNAAFTVPVPKVTDPLPPADNKCSEVASPGPLSGQS